MCSCQDQVLFCAHSSAELGEMKSEREQMPTLLRINYLVSYHPSDTGKNLCGCFQILLPATSSQPPLGTGTGGGTAYTVMEGGCAICSQGSLC